MRGGAGGGLRNCELLWKMIKFFLLLNGDLVPEFDLQSIFSCLAALDFISCPL